MRYVPCALRRVRFPVSLAIANLRGHDDILPRRRGQFQENFNFSHEEITAMKKSVFVLLVLVTICLGLQATSQSQETSQLEVTAAAMCKNVVDLEPVYSGTSFPVSLDTLYCFTKVAGAQSPTQVTHVWYFDGTERARVALAVNSVSWRTYSSKIIQPHEMGAWRVDVLDADGKVLRTLEFEVKP